MIDTNTNTNTQADVVILSITRGGMPVHRIARLMSGLPQASGGPGVAWPEIGNQEPVIFHCSSQALVLLPVNTKDAKDASLALKNMAEILGLLPHCKIAWHDKTQQVCHFVSPPGTILLLADILAEAKLAGTPLPRPTIPEISDPATWTREVFEVIAEIKKVAQP